MSADHHQTKAHSVCVVYVCVWFYHTSIWSEGSVEVVVLVVVVVVLVVVVVTGCMVIPRARRTMDTGASAPGVAFLATAVRPSVTFSTAGEIIVVNKLRD